jgi:mono/diheme cytochrome c family protein
MGKDMLMNRIVICAAALAALAFSAEPSPAQDVAAGKALAEKQCARCHATGADGASAYQEAPPFRDIVKRYPVDNLAEALAEGITVGHHAMPEFTFSPDQIGDLLAYLEMLKK